MSEHSESRAKIDPSDLKDPVEYSYYLSLVEDFSSYLKSLSFSLFSIKAYKKDCLNFLYYIYELGIDLKSIGIDTINDYSSYLLYTKEDRPTSIRRKLLAIRKFFSYLGSKNIVHIEYDKILLPLRDDSLPSDLNTESIYEIVQDLYKSSSSLKDLRDTAIFLLLAIEGLKSCEILTLSWADFIESSTPQSSTLKISGSKERLIEICDEVKLSILKYRSSLLDYLGVLPFNMFVCFKSRLHTKFENLSPDGIKFIIRSISKNYKVKLNAELLRHHAVSYMLSIGKSNTDIQFHLGLKRSGNISKHAPIQKILDQPAEITG